MRTPVSRVSLPNAAAPVSFGAGLTNPGRLRARNEDAILTDPTGSLWAVADGMGGYGHGDVASDLVVDTLLKAPDGGDPDETLVSLLEEANELVHRKAQSVGTEIMGSTVVALLIDRAIGHVAWAGDSRAYLLRNGALRLLTRDHTVVQDLVEQGMIAEVDARSHVEAHIVTRAVGAAAELEVDLATVPLVSGDRLLLCSDGLTACLGDLSIAWQLAIAVTPEEACQRLVGAALDDGAPDNVSVVVVFVGEA